MRVGIVVPHIFMHRDILGHVIFSPGTLAVDLAEGLQQLGVDVTLFSPGPITTQVKNSTADLTYFEQELKGRGDTYIELLKKHPFTFVTLARQVQGELIAKAYAMANRHELDVVHIYTNEEETALSFAALCNKPVVFTHHDPFNFLVKYKNFFPKYAGLNWVSLSYAQRNGMPPATQWVRNIYNGLAEDRFSPYTQPAHNDYIAYLGRIIEPKGVHLAIAAAKKAGIKLKIAGKHYAGHKKDTYWQQYILPHISETIEYVGFIANDKEKRDFLGNARALIVPSVYEEPFGMVMIEALACGTPIIGLNSGAIPEVVTHETTGFVVHKDEGVNGLVRAIKHIHTIDRHTCRADFEARFTLAHMCEAYAALYKNLQNN